MKPKTIGVILVKSNSKRLPGKNMLKFKGYPLWRYQVQQMFGLVDEVHIIADENNHTELYLSMPTKKVSQPWHIHIRPTKLMGDEVPHVELMDWWINTQEEHSTFVVFQATNPHFDQDLLRHAIMVFNEEARHAEGTGKKSLKHSMMSVNPATMKYDGNFFIGSTKDRFVDKKWMSNLDTWICTTNKLNPSACDIDEWVDYCIATAVAEGRTYPTPLAVGVY